MPKEIRITYDSEYQYKEFEEKTCTFYRSLSYEPWGVIPQKDGTQVLVLHLYKEN